FFFFQAEDGIRDSSVAGVQTFALPLSSAIDVVILVDRLAETLAASDALVVSVRSGSTPTGALATCAFTARPAETSTVSASETVRERKSGVEGRGGELRRRRGGWRRRGE